MDRTYLLAGGQHYLIIRPTIDPPLLWVRRVPLYDIKGPVHRSTIIRRSVRHSQSATRGVL